MKLALSLALRLAACLVFSWLAWRIGGVPALVLSLVMFGVALARPLIELAGALRQRLRAAVWEPLEGRHFVFRGQPVQVLEDAEHRRWIRAADVRRIVGISASDGALALSYPNGWQTMGRPAEPHFSDDALLAHLDRQGGWVALKFRHWVEREIAFEARRQRRRFGTAHRLG